MVTRSTSQRPVRRRIPSTKHRFGDDIPSPPRPARAAGGKFVNSRSWARDSGAGHPRLAPPRCRWWVTGPPVRTWRDSRRRGRVPCGAARPPGRWCHAPPPAARTADGGHVPAAHLGGGMRVPRRGRRRTPEGGSTSMSRQGGGILIDMYMYTHDHRTPSQMQ